MGKYYVGDYSHHKKLQPGMVFTIEPGLYFSTDGATPARYRGIGVRIEDDILITPTGCRVLTSGVPREIEEVESTPMHSRLIGSALLIGLTLLISELLFVFSQKKEDTPQLRAKRWKKILRQGGNRD